MLVFDIDNTLCFNRSTIAPPIRGAIVNALRHHQVVFASARHPRDMYHVLKPEFAGEAWLIGCNGALAFKSGEVIYQDLLRSTSVAEILETLDRSQCSYLVDGIYQSCRTPDTGDLRLDVIVEFDRFKLVSVEHMNLAEVTKILALPGRETAPMLRAELSRIGNIRMYTHSDGSLDITSAGVDKFRCLKQIRPDQSTFAAFGDDVNDIAMLRNARISVLIGDKIEDTLQATYQLAVTSQTEQQIARLIEKCSDKLLRS